MSWGESRDPVWGAPAPTLPFVLLRIVGLVTPENGTAVV